MKWINEWSKYIEEKKVIIWIYFCDYGDPNFNKYTEKFKIMPIDWWVDPSKGHHRGFAIESILDVDSIEEAEEIVRMIFSEFDENILIVYSEQRVSNDPVGTNTSEVFTEGGREFDRLVRAKEKGIYKV